MAEILTSPCFTDSAVRRSQSLDTAAGSLPTEHGGSAFQYLFNEMMNNALTYGSRIVGGTGGVLQVASGALLINTGVGIPLGTLMIMQGSNNIQEAWTGGEGYLRGSYAFWFGDNADIAYASGWFKEYNLLGKYGNIEYTGPMYKFERMNNNALIFETLNNGNTIYSNSGGK